jgi:hypothetical protein
VLAHKARADMARQLMWTQACTLVIQSEKTANDEICVAGTRWGTGRVVIVVVVVVITMAVVLYRVLFISSVLTQERIKRKRSSKCKCYLMSTGIRLYIPQVSSPAHKSQNQRFLSVKSSILVFSTFPPKMTKHIIACIFDVHRYIYIYAYLSYICFFVRLTARIHALLLFVSYPCASSGI